MPSRSACGRALPHLSQLLVAPGAPRLRQRHSTELSPLCVIMCPLPGPQPEGDLPHEVGFHWPCKCAQPTREGQAPPVSPPLPLGCLTSSPNSYALTPSPGPPVSPGCPPGPGLARFCSQPVSVFELPLSVRVHHICRNRSPTLTSFSRKEIFRKDY